MSTVEPRIGCNETTAIADKISACQLTKIQRRNSSQSKPNLISAGFIFQPLARHSPQLSIMLRNLQFPSASANLFGIYWGGAHRATPPV
jgi:hypothetical protein